MILSARAAGQVVTLHEHADNLKARVIYLTRQLYGDSALGPGKFHCVQSCETRALGRSWPCGTRCSDGRSAQELGPYPPRARAGSTGAVSPISQARRPYCCAGCSASAGSSSTVATAGRPMTMNS